MRVQITSLLPILDVDVPNPGILCVFFSTCILYYSILKLTQHTLSLFIGKMALRKKIFSFCSWKQKLRIPGKHTLKMRNKSLVSIEFLRNLLLTNNFSFLLKCALILFFFLAYAKDIFPPEFQYCIPINKTRSGMQVTIILILPIERFTGFFHNVF